MTRLPSIRGLACLVSAAVIIVGASSAMSRRQSTPSAQDLAGKWEGVLAGQLHIVLTIEKKADGAYAGSLNSVDQGAVLEMANITLRHDAVHFEVTRVGGVYDGALSQDRNDITGTWTQTGAPPQPLSFKRGGTGSAPSEPAKATNEAPTPTPKPLTAPLDITIPIEPKAFEADGQWHIAYELHIASLGSRDCTVTSIEVVSGDSAQKSIAKFAGVGLPSILVHPGQKQADATKIAAGSFAVAYMWATVDAAADLPATMRQRITMKVGDYPEDVVLETSAIAIDHSPLVVISPPLRGGNWLAGNGPSNSSGHRRALIPIDGVARISQRFAIDWVELYPDGKSYQGNPADNKNYRDYGAEVHSVADGVVTEVKDGIPQNVPGENSRAVPITLETVGGNHVIVRIGDGLYAFYAHMQPGSLRVKVGDKVARGQVLGLVGNSGNSTEPHLHFDICNESSMLGCEGLPYVFASFEVQGKGWGWKSSDAHEPGVKHEMEIPMENEIVRFEAARVP